MTIRWARAVSHLSELPVVADAGFDAAELPVGTVMELSAGEFERERTALDRSGLVFEVFSAPLPAGATVTEPGFNIYVWSVYLKRTFERVAEVGCRRIVWSDGKGRLLPVEGGVDAAKRQVLQFLYVISDLARAHGIDVLVEPLDPRRTNFLNTITELGEFLARAGRANISGAISLRDLDAVGLSPSSIERHAHLISHVYIENPETSLRARHAPRPGDEHAYDEFLASLSRIGYSGCITLPSDADEESLGYCRSLLAD